MISKNKSYRIIEQYCNRNDSKLAVTTLLQQLQNANISLSMLEWQIVYIACVYKRVLIFASSQNLSVIYLFQVMIHWWGRKPPRGPNNCMFWAMTEAEGEVGYALNRFKPPSNFFTDRSKAVLLLWFIFMCYNIYNVCLLHGFVAALPSALYFVLSKLALWPPHFNSCSPCFP